MKSILLNFYSLNKNLRQDNYDIVFYTFNPTKSTYGSREREREREREKVIKNIQNIFHVIIDDRIL